MQRKKRDTKLTCLLNDVPTHLPFCSAPGSLSSADFSHLIRKYTRWLSRAKILSGEGDFRLCVVEYCCMIGDDFTLMFYFKPYAVLPSRPNV